MYQEFKGHSGAISKIKVNNDYIVTTSSSKDGFLVWKFKGSQTYRVRNETYKGINELEDQILNLDFENNVTDEEIDRMINTRPDQLNNIKKGEINGERVRFDSTFERQSNDMNNLNATSPSRDRDVNN